MPFWILSTRQKLPHTTVNIPMMFHEVWWKKSKLFKNPPFFNFHGKCGKICPTDSDFFAYLVPLDVDVTGNITAKLCEVWSEFNIFAPWLPWQRPPFWFFSTPKSCHTLRWIFLQSLMKGIQKYFKSPFFCFHGNCGKVCPTDSDFFGLSRSTRCGCCSYEVSLISV